MLFIVQVTRRIVLKQKNAQNNNLKDMKITWDKNLVNQLIGEFPIKQSVIKEIVNDGHGSLNRGEIRRIYERLSDYSDFFGLPTWSLLTEDSCKEVMPNVKEDMDKNIDPYRISDLEEILNYIALQSEGLKLQSDDRTHVSLIVDKLKEILERHERWSESWRVILSLNKNQLIEKNKYEWNGNLLFTYNNEIIYRGTLRFYKKSIKGSTPKLNDCLKTSWFFIKKMIPSAQKPRLILSIVDDISSEIFNCRQPHISMNTENDAEMLFSWNNNFKKTVITLPDLTSNFRDRMSYLNSISIYTVFKMNELFYQRESEGARSPEEDKSSINQAIDISPRISTLDYLLINGYINEGDQILFKNGEDSSSYEVAEIIIAYNKTMLLWRGVIYHFTTLTNKLLCKRISETLPNYCAKYWYIPGRQYSLFELANFVKMIHKF
jgi:hypothetical protein